MPLDTLLAAAAFLLWWVLYGETTWIVWKLSDLGLVPRDLLYPEGAAGELPAGLADMVWLVAFAVANGLAEEVVMRGYLITRLRRILGSTIGAVALSTVLFAAYHTYQGALGVYSVLLFGTILAVVFVVTKRLWPCMLAHIAGDIVPYLAS